MANADKPTVIKILRDIALLLQIQGESPFKSRAYDTGADRIAGLTEDLDVVVAEGRLREIPGIGEALAKKIAELVTTGQLEYYERLRAEMPPGILELVRVPELGPKKAHALWKELGVGDVDALERACREGRVRGLKGFGKKSEENLLESVALYRRLTADNRRPIGEVLPVAEALLERVRSAPGVERASLAGSVRRFRETVKDVDIVASAEDSGPVFDAITSLDEVADVIGRGDTKCSVRLVEGDLQVDLRVVPDADFATALHHFTGSKAHHVRLRGIANAQGLSISEWGVTRGDDKLRVTSEEDIYRLLGMQAVPPELREGWGEVEAALEGQLPEDLVTLGDLRGVVHSHSTWSDGKASLEAMAVAARERGYSYLTVTDHSRTASYAGGLTEDDLQRQWDEVDGLNDRLTGIRLLKGIESDILEDGSLDYPARVLERFDLVIGSIHQRHKLDEDAMTKRVLRALDNPHMHIWGHPTGRLLGQREPAPMRMEELLSEAASKGVAVEVNGIPDRLDLKAEHVRLALARGVRLVLSADAHSVPGIDHLRFAAATARKGWARRGDVLNTLPVDRFLAELRGR